MNGCAVSWWSGPRSGLAPWKMFVIGKLLETVGEFLRHSAWVEDVGGTWACQWGWMGLEGRSKWVISF